MGKRAKPEEIIAKFRAVEVRLSQGETTGQAVCAIGVTEQTYYRWRKDYGIKISGRPGKEVVRIHIRAISTTRRMRQPRNGHSRSNVELVSWARSCRLLRDTRMTAMGRE